MLSGIQSEWTYRSFGQSLMFKVFGHGCLLGSGKRNKMNYALRTNHFDLLSEVFQVLDYRT